MSDSRLREAERLLDEERRALMDGDLAALAGLVERKEALAHLLSGSDVSRERLAVLKVKAERNAELLAASARGVRTVIRRIGEIRDANGPLRTYGRDGMQQTLGTAAGSLEKRA